MPTFGYGATYGKFLYGAQKYGSTANLNAIFNWSIEVDWNGDGVFDGYNEAERFIDFQVSRGRKNYIQPTGNGFYPVSVGTFHVTLDNFDGRYDPWNTSSRYYPNVTYGKEIRVEVTDIASNITYPIFYGIISDIVPSGYGSNAVVKITAEDGLRYLRNNYSYNYIGGIAGATPATIVTQILSDTGWKWGTSIATGPAIPYYVYNINKNALDSINEISDSVTGDVFIVTNTGDAKLGARDGGDVYAIDQSVLLKDIGNPFPYINFRNITKLYWSTYGSTAAKTITTYPSSTAGISNPATFAQSLAWIQDSTSATDYNNYIGGKLATKTKTPILQMVNKPTIQFADLTSLIQLTVAKLGINENFALMGIEHHGKPQEVTTVFYLEPPT